MALALAFATALVPATSETARAATPSSVWEWGTNTFGELGTGGTSTTPAAPAAVQGLTDVVAVRGGREHVVALTSGGTVYTWGHNQLGQLGLGDTVDRALPTPVTVPCVSGGVTAVETGHDNTFALCGNGTVWSWGLNTDGQLGDGTRVNRTSPVRVTGVNDAVSIAAGRDMAYAVRADGTLLAWGDNAYGEVGDGSLTDRLTPVPVPGLTSVTQVAGGRDHALVLRADGSVWAFGWNLYGQLGDGTTVDRSTPVPVTTGVQRVAAGAHHSYALRTDGQVLSWGRNYRDELGDGTTTMRTRPVPVIGVTSAVSIASGRDHGMAVMADGTVMTWGYNLSGQLGDGTTTSRTRAVTVPGVTGATKAGGGGSEYSVVLVGAAAPPVNKPPTARFTSSCQQLTCTFDATSSVDADGTITTYAWDLGDQSQDSGPVVTHTFSAAGTFQVTLTVTDDDAATGTLTTAVNVSDAPPPTLTYVASATVDLNTAKPTVRVPTQVATGDQLLLFVTTNRAATASTPAGWTLLGVVSDGTDVRSWAFARSAASTTPGSSVQVTLDASSKANVTLLGYRGAGAPSASAAGAETGTTSLHHAPGLVVPASGSTVVSYWSDKVAAPHGWTLPAGQTQRTATVGSGTGQLTTTSGDAAAVAAGPWPGVTADAGVVSAKAVAWTVVLPPS